MKRGIFVSCAMVIFMILLSFQVMAQEGKTEIIPKISVQGVFDDNIYLTDTDEESDSIIHLKPALFLDYSFNQRGGVHLDYQGDFAYYMENDENDWQTHKGLFDLNYSAPGGVIVRVKNTYTDAEDPYGNKSEYGVGEITERWNNDLETALGFDFGNRFKFLAYFNYYKQDYEQDDDFTQDYKTSEYGVGFQMRFLPKTWAFFRYHSGERDYFTQGRIAGAVVDVDESNDADFDYQRANIGITWDSGAKLIGELNFGYQWKDYDNTSDVSDNPYDDHDTWIASTSINYIPYQATYGPEFSLATLNIRRALRQYGSDSRDYFEETAIGFVLSQALYAKFFIKEGLEFQKNKYNNPYDEKSDSIFFNFDVDYKIQDWLSAGAGYRYKTRDSTVDSNDYTDNQLILTLNAVF